MRLRRIPAEAADSHLLIRLLIEVWGIPTPLDAPLSMRFDAYARSHSDRVAAHSIQGVKSGSITLTRLIVPRGQAPVRCTAA
jgi:hypothetical protein